MTPNEAIKHTWDFSRVIETIWRPGVLKAVNDYVRPTVPNGFAYQCTTAGQTDSREPSWPTELGATKVDGTVTWTCVAAGSNGRDAINSAEVTAEPNTLDIDDLASDETTVTAKLSGAAGSYQIKSKITTTGTGEEFEDEATLLIGL